MGIIIRLGSSPTNSTVLTCPFFIRTENISAHVAILFKGWWGKKTHSRTTKGSLWKGSHCPIIATGCCSWLQIYDWRGKFSLRQWHCCAEIVSLTICNALWASSVHRLGALISVSPFNNWNRGANIELSIPHCTLIQFIFPSNLCTLFSVLTSALMDICCGWMVCCKIFHPRYS